MLASSKRLSLEILPFFIRRCFRISPLYYLGMAFYVLLPIMVGQRRSPCGVLLNSIYIHGFVPSFQNNVVPGGWSIGCEMAFYAVFPLLFRWVDDRKRSIALLTFSIALDSVLLVVGRARGWSTESTVGLYYHPVFQLPAFATGIAIYNFSKERSLVGDCDRWRFHVLAFFGFIGMVMLYAKSHHQTWALPPVALCVGAIVYGCIMAPPRFLSHGLMVRLGLISFSMYIWHFAVLFGGVARLPIPGIHPQGTLSTMETPFSTFLVFLITLAVSWPLAELSRKYIEVPGMVLGQNLIKRIHRPKQGTDPVTRN